MATFQKALDTFRAAPLPKETRFADAKLVLEGIGFELLRSKGSHFIFVNERTGRQVVLAVHGGKIKAAAVRDIAKQVREWQEG